VKTDDGKEFRLGWTDSCVMDQSEFCGYKTPAK